MLSFEEEYFRTRRYSYKECLVKKHFLEVLKWASKVSDVNFLDGKRKTALSVGCGYGYEVDVLQSLGYDAYGVDISRYGAKKAKGRFLSMDFVVCDAQKGLPFENNAFDLVACFGVLEHLVKPLQALENMFATCRDAIICTTPNRLVEKPVKQIIKDFDETHINVKSRKEWEKTITANLNYRFLKIEPFFDASLRTASKLLFFKSFKTPYFGLDFRILIRK